MKQEVTEATSSKVKYDVRQLDFNCDEGLIEPIVQLFCDSLGIGFTDAKQFEPYLRSGYALGAFINKKLIIGALLATGMSEKHARDYNEVFAPQIHIPNHEEAVELCQLCVSPDHRNNGIGSELLRIAMDESRVAGYSQFFAISRDNGKDKHLSKGILARLGFQETHVIYGYFADDEKFTCRICGSDCKCLARIFFKG